MLLNLCQKPGQRFAQVIGLTLSLWGAACLIGASAGSVDPLKPMDRLGIVGSLEGGQTEAVRWEAVKTVTDVNQWMVSSSRPILLDLYADWCISCKVMERSVFPEPGVAEQLTQFTLLRADVTANDAQDRALLKKFGLFGPPSLVFFGEDGSELAEYRVQGEVSAERLRYIWRILAL